MFSLVSQSLLSIKRVNVCPLRLGIRDLLARSSKAMSDPKYYFHCEGNRAYLEADVLPMVEQGGGLEQVESS